MRRIRQQFAPFVLDAMAARGGDDTTAPNPGGRSGGAITLAISAGAGQAGSPRAALANTPVAIARNQSEQPVSGLTITFEVDSGGGTVASAAATTSADGTARTGQRTSWMVSNTGIRAVRVAHADDHFRSAR